MRTAWILGVATLACGGSEDGFTCDFSAREGTYELTYDERAGGTCGPVETSIVRVNPNADSVVSPSGATTCTAAGPPDLSADECDFTTSIVCNDAAGFVLEATAITTQENDDRLSGTVSMVIRDAATAETLCTSTYDVEYVRR